jgi:hypothetical protein
MTTFAIFALDGDKSGRGSKKAVRGNARQHHNEAAKSPAGDILKHSFLFLIASAPSLSALAQTNRQQSAALEPSGSAPNFVVNEVSRTVQAVNYQHHSGATSVDFAGTGLLPSADGNAKVRSKRGTMEVEAEFSNLQTPMTFGNEYLTYVLWAISPDGRAVS